MTVEDFTEALKRRNTTPAVDLTEDGLAAEFTRRHRDHLRYVALWGAWMHWDGRCWQREPTLMAFDLARAVCRYTGDGLDNIKLRARILSAGTRAAVENLARSDRAHAALPEQWDAYPWHLNTTGGIVDLVTATVRPHDPLAYHTKITAIAPGGECPLWRDFLKRITDGDDDLQAYLQRSAGYALTGSIREHVLQFGYGTGANGKGTYLNTLTGIMRDYACTAPMETFTPTTGERHPTDLAMLRGARLVTAQETEQGRRWAEAKIKALTGGDPISARFMRQDFFYFLAAVQAVYRRQPPPRPERRRRGYPTPHAPCSVQRHDPGKGPRPRAARKA
jgi:putative DNA primase/helicase